MNPGFRQSTSKEHLPALDGLRTVAVALVLMMHGAEDLPRRMFGFASAGWCGVDLFFVLSGFLITGGLLSSKTSLNYFRSFYGKRLLRIFPVYYLALLLYLVILPRIFSGLPGPPAHDRLFYWIYLSNWTGLLHMPKVAFVGHFWSLAVEEQFYLVWPAVVLLVSRRGLFWIAGVCVATAPMIRLMLFRASVSPETMYRGTFCRMDGLMLGAICALLLSDEVLRERTRRLLPLIAPVGALLLALPWVLYGPTYYRTRMMLAGYSLCDLGLACLLLCCVLAPKYFAPLGWKVLRRLGVWSYGIYVYHFGLMYLASRYPVFGTGLHRFLAETMLSVALAAASYELVERRILMLKQHFAPRWTEDPGRRHKVEGLWTCPREWSSALRLAIRRGGSKPSAPWPRNDQEHGLAFLVGTSELQTGE